MTSPFTSVRQVTDAIRTFIDAGNDGCAPFFWTTTADGDAITTRERRTSLEVPATTETAGRLMLGVGVLGLVATLIATLVAQRVIGDLIGGVDQSVELTVDLLETVDESFVVAEQALLIVADGTDEASGAIRALGRSLDDGSEALERARALTGEEIADALEQVEAAMPALQQAAAAMELTLRTPDDLDRGTHGGARAVRAALPRLGAPCRAACLAWSPERSWDDLTRLPVQSCVVAVLSGSSRASTPGRRGRRAARPSHRRVAAQHRDGELHDEQRSGDRDRDPDPGQVMSDDEPGCAERSEPDGEPHRGGRHTGPAIRPTPVPVPQDGERCLVHTSPTATSREWRRGAEGPGAALSRRPGGPCPPSTVAGAGTSAACR